MLRHVGFFIDNVGLLIAAISIWVFLVRNGGFVYSALSVFGLDTDEHLMVSVVQLIEQL